MDALSLSRRGMKDEESFSVRLALGSRVDGRNGALDQRLSNGVRLAGGRREGRQRAG
jgi:hypothetical protein